MMLPGIGDYTEPEVEETAEDYWEGWYLFNDDRTEDYTEGDY